MSNRFITRLLSNFEELADQVFCHVLGNESQQEIRWRDLEIGCKRYLGQYRLASLPAQGQILIFLRHGPDLYTSYFGAMLGGFIPSFMPCSSPKQDPRIYWESHSQLLAHIAPAAIVATAATFDEMAGAGLDLGTAKKIVVDDIGSSDCDVEFTQLPEHSVALLQHSSGTTGLKKGTALSYAAVVNQLESYGSALGLNSSDVVVSWLPLYHDMGLVACCILPSYFAIPIVHLDAFYWLSRPESLFECIAHHKGTLTWLPNFAYEHLVRTAGRRKSVYHLSGMRAFINCSEPCKASSFDRFLAAFKDSGVRADQLQCCYAMAESVFAVSQTEPGHPAPRLAVDPTTLARGNRPVPPDNSASLELLQTGRPIPGIEVTIHDEERVVLGDGMVGEVGLKGDFMFSGYNKNPQETSRKISNGTYFTGDIGFMKDGGLYILGRTDDMIVVNGRNLFAHEIESALLHVHGVKAGRSVALPIYDSIQGTSTLAIVSEKDPGSIRPDTEVQTEIVTRIFSTFAVHPRVVRLVDEGWLVKTTSGKVSRKENMAKLLIAIKS